MIKTNYYQILFLLYYHLCLTSLSLIPASDAPSNLSTCFPPLKYWNVGIQAISHALAVSLFSSTSTLAKITSFSSAARASNFGAINLHGGHHVAKKSTTIRFFSFRRVSNCSLVAIMFTFPNSNNFLSAIVYFCIFFYIPH